MLSQLLIAIVHEDTTDSMSLCIMKHAVRRTTLSRRSVAALTDLPTAKRDRKAEQALGVSSWLMSRPDRGCSRVTDKIVVWLAQV